MPGCSVPEIDIRLIPASALQPVAWKNGGGVTREIARSPENPSKESFLWRISMADVAQEGPFSAFEGMERILVVVHGGAMVLIDTGTEARQVLTRFEPFQFPGETPIRAELPEGAIQDFNLMWRRDLAQGQVYVRRTAQILGLDPGTVVLHCPVGSYRVAMATADLDCVLEQGDTLALTLPGAAACHLDIQPLVNGAILLDSRIHAMPMHSTQSDN